MADAGPNRQRETTGGGAPPPQAPKRSAGRINANHLLNIQPSYVAPGSSPGTSRRPNQGPAPRRRPAPRPQAYDRTKFLQANFRFLVSDAVDVRHYKADPDLMLDWEDVVSVEMLSTTPITCPIALSEPFCPQITPCGHIFSYDAIMAHMIAQGGSELRASAACPLCATPVAARELRLVKVRKVEPVKAGDVVSLRLLKRDKDSIIPCATCLPPSSVAGEEGNEHILSPLQYAKFTTTTDPTSLWIADAEKLARHASKLLAEGGTEAAYEIPPVLAAIESLAARAKSWAERRRRQLMEKKGDNDDDDLNIVGGGGGGGITAAFATSLAIEEAGVAARDAIRKAAEAATIAMEKEIQLAAQEHALHESFPALGTGSSNSCGQTNAPVAAASAVSVEQQPSSAPHVPSSLAPPQEDNTLYFYQASDGQWLFLCPLNMKMMAAHFGSFAGCPPTITARVLEIEEELQTTTTRKKFRALAHLPLSGSFKTLELDLTSLLPAEALAPFSQDVSQRAKRRAQQAKQEARQRAKEAARAAADALRRDNAPLSAQELASMPLPSASLRSNADLAAQEEEIINDDGDLQINDNSLNEDASASVPIPGTSFATIARLGFAATGPALGNSPPMSTSDGGGGGNGNFPALGSDSSPTPGGVWGGQSPTTSGAWGTAAATVSSGTTTTVPAWGGASGSVATAGGVPPLPTPVASGRGKKGGSGKQKMVLLSSTHRRY